MNRRQFLKSLGASILPLLAPHFALANTGISQNRRIVLLVELKGANDGLNTLVPYTSQVYYDARPNLALERNSVLKVSSTLGLHPALSPLMSAWDDGSLAWAQGLGYAEPNRSHFESIEIWESGSADLRETSDGWVANCFPGSELTGVAIDTNLGPFYGDQCSALSISDPYRFINQGRNIQAMRSSVTNPALQHILDVQSNIDILASSLAEYLSDVPAASQAFAKKPFGRSLNSVYTLIASGINVPAYKVTLSNFDTHINQRGKHENLLTQLAEGLAAMRTNLQHLGMWDEVVIMTYSEFGRRVHENANKGTDHGAAAPHLVMGGKVKGGWYGEYPSLTDLDRGDLQYTTDFRDLYATLQQDWWKVPVSEGRSLGFI